MADGHRGFESKSRSVMLAFADSEHL